jgi:hypothetical protein
MLDSGLLELCKPWRVPRTNKTAPFGNKARKEKKMGTNYDPQERDEMFQKGFSAGANSKPDETKPNLQDYWKDFPEAPFSDTFKWVDADGFEHMTTVRGWGDKSLSDGITKAKALIQYNGGKPVGKFPTAPAPTPDPAARIALEEDNKALAVELQEQASALPAAPDGKQWNITDIAFVKILPQPGDKITIEFYAADRKTPHNDYPAMKVNKWDIGRAAGLMKHVTSADVTKPAEFMLNCHVYWLDGKEYTDTSGTKKHYKDIYHVR